MKKLVVPYTVKAACLPAGEELVVTNNTVRSRRHLSFNADIKALGDGKLILGHGYMKTSGSWVEITGNQVQAFSYYSYSNPQLQPLLREEMLHELAITDFITVNLDHVPLEKTLYITIFTASGSFKGKIPRWYGADGDIAARFEGVDAENCVLNWSCDDFASRIWLIGDSYLGTGAPSRWPYYLYRDGYTSALMVGYAGMNSQRGIKDFRVFVEKGQPEYAVWCLGMNNGDKDGVLNADYLAATEEFLAICEARGITPVLSTIPNTPIVNNRQKNEWVRAQPYRYIDFERAVGSHKDENWYPEMIFRDQVHPAEKGAAALYARVLVDFPEIMERN